MNLKRFCCLLSAVFLTGALSCHAVLTRKWIDSGFKAFSLGRCRGISLSSDGLMSFGASLTRLPGDSPDLSIISLTSSPDGTIFAGTAFQGKVLVRRRKDKDFSVLIDTDELMITSLLFTRGTLWAATAPNGRLLAIDVSEGKIRKSYSSGETYIWDILPSGKKGKGLLLATGPRGRLLSFVKGVFTLRYEGRFKHLRCLARATDGSVLAGTAEGGLLLRLKENGAGPARALFQPRQPECTAISVDRETGTVYLCATTPPKATGNLKPPASPANKKPAPPHTPGQAKKTVEPTAASPDSVNDTGKNKAVNAHPGTKAAASHGAGRDNHNQKRTRGRPAAPTASSLKTRIGGSLSPEKEDAIRRYLEAKGVSFNLSKAARHNTELPPASKVPFSDGAVYSKHAVYSIDSNGTVRTLFSSNDAVLFCMCLDSSGRILVGSGDEGILYRIDPCNRRVERLARTGEEQVVSMLHLTDGAFLGTSGNGHFYSLSSTPSSTGVYVSDVKKLPHTARFGSVALYGRSLNHARITVYTRSGFTDEPDETWSSWRKNRNKRSTSPPARFFQYKLLFKSAIEGRGDFAIETVEILFRPLNLAPRISSITISPPSVSLKSNRQELKVAANGKPAPKRGKVLPSYIRKVSWKAVDPNGDSMLYRVYLKSGADRDWMDISQEDLTGSAIVWETKSIPDGRYRIRVTACDSPDNFSEDVLEDSLVSNSFVVDNSQPDILFVNARVKDDKLLINGRAADATSRVLNVEYSLNGDYYKPLSPVDGMFDSPAEKFSGSVKLEKSTKPSTLAVKVFDEYGNTSQAKIFIVNGKGRYEGR